MADELQPINQEVNIDIKTNADKAADSQDALNVSITETTTETKKNTEAVKQQETEYKSLKAQLKEAILTQQQLSQKFGSTSNEAIAAAKNVAKLKDEIGFQKDLVDSYNPDDKFRALTQTAGLAALALGGVKDGLSAIGVESKTLDKVIGTAQAILGVTSAIGGLTDAYEVLTASKKAKSAADVVEIGTTEALAVAETEATAATTSWTTALLANPIVLIAAAIAAAGAGIYAYTKHVSGAVSEQERLDAATLVLNQSISDQEKAFNKTSSALSAYNNYQLGLAKASGKSADEVNRLERELAASETNLARRNENIARKRLTDLAAQGIYDKDINDKAIKALEDAQKIREAAAKNEIEIVRKQEIAKAQAATDAAEKIAEAEKAKKLKLKTDKKTEQDKLDAEELASEKKKAEDLEAAKQKSAEDDKARAKEVQDAIDKATEANIEGQLSAQEVEIRNVKDKYFQLIEEAKQFGRNTAELTDAQANEINDINLKYQKQKQDATDAADAIALQAKQDNQNKIIDLGEQLIANTAKLAGKNRAIQKAAIIADGAVSVGKTIANTSEAVGKDLAKGFPFSAPLVALDLAVGATSVASIIKGTNDALKGVGGGSLSSSSSGVASVPSRNVAQVGFQGSNSSQIANAVNQSQKNQPPIQAFVVSQAVTDQQEIDRQKKLNNSF